VATFFDIGEKTLPARYDKCLNVGGNYEEKYKCGLPCKNKIVTKNLLVLLYLNMVLA
jgi:hypothetical protein